MKRIFNNELSKYVHMHLFFSFLSSFAYCQSLSIITVGSGGYDSKISAETHIDWSVGEFAVESGRLNDGYITQGFHQPFVSGNKTEKTDFISREKIRAYPNPATESVRIFCESWENESLQIRVVGSANQAYLKSYFFYNVNRNVSIDISRLIAGVYFFEVKNLITKNISVIRIVKLN